MQLKKPLLLGSLIAACIVLAGGSLALAHGMGGGFRHGGMDMGEMTEHLQVHVQHVLDEVDATPEQRAQIKDIVATATKDLAALHEQHGGAHKELHEIFTAPVIDRVKLESVRAEPDFIRILHKAEERSREAAGAFRQAGGERLLGVAG